MRRLQRRKNEAGSISGMFVVLAVSVVLMVGLVVDGGRLMTNRRDATDAANEAARAAAQTVSEADYATGGGIVIDDSVGGDAWNAAANVATASGLRLKQVIATPDGRVTIRVEKVVELPMLALLGVPRRTVTATGIAEPRPGLESEG